MNVVCGVKTMAAILFSAMFAVFISAFIALHDVWISGPETECTLL